MNLTAKKSLITDDKVHTFGDENINAKNLHQQSAKQIDNYQQQNYEQQLREINNPEDLYLKHMDQEKIFYDNQKPQSIKKFENHPHFYVQDSNTFLASDFQPETSSNNDQNAYYHQMLNSHHLQDYNKQSHEFQHVHLSEAEIEAELITGIFCLERFNK